MSIFTAIKKAFSFGVSSAGSYSSELSRIRNLPGTSRRPEIEKLLDMYGDHTWVFACIKVIQTKGAGVPIRVYKDVNGKPQALPNHVLQRLLDSVNPFMNGYDLMEGTHGYIELTGNCYWLKDRLVGNRPQELYPLIPSFVFPIIKSAGIEKYEYRINGKLVDTFDPAEIVHFRTWNPNNPFIGIPALFPSRDAIDSVMNADRYESTFFRNGAEPGSILTSEQPIDPTDRKVIEESWRKSHQGVKNAWKIAVLGGGLKWQSTAMSHADMMLPDLKKMSVRDIIAAFCLQPVMLGLHEDSNYTNAKEQRRAFWEDCMFPRFKKIESTLNERLVREVDPSVYVAHDLSEIQDLQEDAKEKAERDAVLTNAGIKKINEVRAEMELPPVPWGDTWNAPMGLMPIEDHSAPVAPAGEPTTPPADNPPQDKPKKEAPKVEKGYIRRSSVWVKFKFSTENMERRWFPTIRRLFSDQEREVIANLRQYWEIKSRHLRMNQVKDMRQDLSVILFERGEARRIFQKTGRKLMELALTASADQQIKDNDLQVQFQVTNPKVSTWLTNKAFKFANAVNLTTEEDLRTQLVEAVNAGETIAEVEKRIEQVFDIARGSRTQMIARTEVISASNAGAQAAYEQSGVVQGTEWVSSRDAKVRDEHQIDGEATPLHEKFSNGLEYPGDPNGEASNVINCRCTIAPVISKE